MRLVSFGGQAKCEAMVWRFGDLLGLADHYVGLGQQTHCLTQLLDILNRLSVLLNFHWQPKLFAYFNFMFIELKAGD